ncbi:ATP-binding cassette domain-containing protein [Sutterella sp.]|uniref:ATP-binding cassette domain-containing protein n=1 Tax=Sutterella sp. TaxID=1981025 RepID=UPI0026DF9ECC|nr:ATP-binding cassette domain-containing protein [Sutterella sp.]MDO5532471.1 ATP-binding cassette domain-containing protein [Sutterella sp.]
MTAAPPISVKGLVRRFRGPDGKPFEAVAGTDIVVDTPGAVVSLIGPDGAGKTTLLRLLAGILTPDEGSVELFGLTPDTGDPAFVEMLGFMPQRFGLYEELSVWENFRIFGALRGVKGAELERRFEALMTLSGLKGFEEREAGKLSGGMKQKLGLSCSLLSEPRLLLLDEPTVGVDPLSRRELWRILDEMRRRTGMTVLVSTAYLDEAARCDLTLVMAHGKLIASGTPAELTQAAVKAGFRPGRAVAQDSAGGPMLARALMRSVRAASPHSIWIDAVPHGDRVELLAAAGADTLPEIPGADISSRTATLEDAYCALTFPGASGTPLKSSEEDADRLGPAFVIPEGDAVVAERISRKFGDFVAVADTSFRVKKGEIFGLLGPNGAGKTTTFRMLCGLLPATSGRISVAGSDLSLARSEARAKVGYVAQKFSLYGQLTARQNLEYFGECFGVTGRTLRRRIAELTDSTDLAGRLAALTEALPLGAKRELALACALIHRPAILFLDEATSGADVAARRAFWRRIVTLSEAGTTVIVTTHFMEEAEYCDRFLIQDAGRVLALGTPSEVRQMANADSIEDAFAKIVLEDRARRASSEGGAS